MKRKIIVCLIIFGIVFSGVSVDFVNVKADDRWPGPTAYELKFRGKVLSVWDGYGYYEWTVKVDKILISPPPSARVESEIHVYYHEGYKGYFDSNINVGDRVEVYGYGTGYPETLEVYVVHDVSLYESYHHIKKIGSGCEDGFLWIHCNEYEYDLYVDGSYRLTEGHGSGQGTSSKPDGICGVKLSAGDHTITLKKDGCDSVTKTVHIGCGEEKTIYLNMDCDPCKNKNCDQYDGYVGDYYCENGDVYRKYRDYYCENGECKYREEERKIRDCDYGCENGGCIVDPCKNKNCDQYDGYVGEKYCKNGDVYRKYRDYYCENGECKYWEEERKIEDCDYGCENGGCKPKSTTTPSPTPKEKITILHLSDLHLLNHARGDKYSIMDWKTVETFVDELRTDLKDEEIDFVVITGDLVNWATDRRCYHSTMGIMCEDAWDDTYEGYEQFVSLLKKEIGYPIVYNVVGNHDYRCDPFAIATWFYDDVSEEFKSRFNYEDFKIVELSLSSSNSNLNLILMNSGHDALDPKAEAGYSGSGFSDSQIEQLTIFLDEHKDDTNLIFCHHPIVEKSSNIINNRDKFLSLCMGYHVPFVLSGHTHRYNSISRHGTEFITIGAAFMSFEYGLVTYENGEVSYQRVIIEEKEKQSKEKEKQSERTTLIGSCPIYMCIEDSQGNKAGFDSSGSYGEIENVYYTGPGEQQFLSFDSSEDITVHLESYAEGEFSFSVYEHGEDKTTCLNYSDIPITEDSKAILSAETDLKKLKLDYDGDGDYDREYKPTVEVVTPERERSFLLPLIAIIILISIVGVYVSREKIGNIGLPRDFDTKLIKKLDNQLKTGKISREEYNQKIKDL